MGVQEDGRREAWLALAGQYGLVTRAQAAAVLSRARMETMVRLGLLVPAGRGVWQVAGAPRSWRQRALGACLAIGPPVAVTGVSAARLWQLDGIAPARPDEPVHLVVPPNRNGKPIPAAVVHRSPLPAPDLVHHLGIPVTRPARTLADLAGSVTEEVLSLTTDDAVRRRLVTPEELQRLRLGHTPGARRLHRVVSARAGSDPGSDSAFEDRVYRWIVAAGLPPPVRQHQVVLPVGGVAVLDLAYPGQRVGIECDGWEWHAGRGRFDRDRVRSSELAVTGWIVLSVTTAQTREEVVQRVGRALAARTAGDRRT